MATLRSRTWRTEVDARTSPEIYRRQLTTHQKDERQRRQDNSNRRRLARQHPSNLLCSLTRERDRHRTARCCLDCASSFAISNCPHARMRHTVCMHIPSIWAHSLLSHFIILSWCSLDWVNHQTCYIMHRALKWYIDMAFNGRNSIVRFRHMDRTSTSCH